VLAVHTEVLAGRGETCRWMSDAAGASGDQVLASKKDNNCHNAKMRLTCAQFLQESCGLLRNRLTMSTHALHMSPERWSSYVMPKHGANSDSKRALLVNRELEVFVPHIQHPVMLWY